MRIQHALCSSCGKIGATDPIRQVGKRDPVRYLSQCCAARITPVWFVARRPRDIHSLN